MITGGELTARQLVFEVGFANAAYNLQTMFAARTRFFLVPPYNERVDVETDGPQIRFYHHDGSPLRYEDVTYVLSKLLLFQALEYPRAKEIRELAQEMLPITSTLLFPDARRTQLECAVFENWMRLVFAASTFHDMAERVKADLAKFLPDTVQISTQSPQELTLRTRKGERLLLSRTVLQKMGGVFVSYGLLLPELYQRFILNVSQFALMQSTRIYLHNALHEIKDAETVGGKVHSSLSATQALRILKALAEHGDIGLLLEPDMAFLSHLRLYSPSEYAVFEGVHGLKPYLQAFIACCGVDIAEIMNQNLAQEGDMVDQVQKDKNDIIEGNTAKTIDREEERRRLRRQHQKKLEE